MNSSSVSSVVNSFHLLRYRIMTRRRLFLPDIWRMTIRALAGLLVLHELFFDRHSLRIRDLLVVLMTARARRDGHVRRQSAQRRGARNVDVAGRAFQDVRTLAALVRVLGRDALRRCERRKCRGR